MRASNVMASMPHPKAVHSRVRGSWGSNRMSVRRQSRFDGDQLAARWRRSKFLATVPRPDHRGDACDGYRTPNAFAPSATPAPVEPARKRKPPPAQNRKTSDCLNDLSHAEA